MEAPSTLTCNLRPYQKQALYWMSESEKGIDVEKAAETLHPCWEAYRICDEYVLSQIFKMNCATHMLSDLVTLICMHLIQEGTFNICEHLQR